MNGGKRNSTTEIARRQAKEDIWLPVPGWGGVYEVSFDGRVRKVKGLQQGVIQQHKKKGQYVVRLTNEQGERREQRVHVLLARAWIGESPGRNYCVFHKNGVRTDNFANNLEYISRKEVGRRTGALASKRAVLKLSEAGEVLEVYPSARAAAKVEPFSYQSITDRCNGKVKKTAGFIYVWEDSHKCKP